jgi:hypothetical protein
MFYGEVCRQSSNEAALSPSWGKTPENTLPRSVLGYLTTAHLIHEWWEPDEDRITRKSVSNGEENHARKATDGFRFSYIST